jgi:hypothetical protein
VAELSFSMRGQFVTVKVFENATPDKFYEFFYEVSETPKMVKPRNMGHPQAVHISEIQHVYKIQGKVNLVYHDRAQYEKLFKLDPNSMAAILEKNMLVSSGSARGRNG